MKFWNKLTQVFLGIFIGYWIVCVMKLIVTYSGFLIVASTLSGESTSFLSLYSLMSLGLLLIGFLVALSLGVIINFLLIAFLPIAGITSSCSTTIMFIGYILQFLMLLRF